MNKSVEIRSTIAIAFATAMLGTSHDARASGTCLGGGSTSTLNTNPPRSWCAFENYLTSGTGDSVLAQETTSSFNSATNALEADSINNTAIFGYTQGNANGSGGPYAVYGEAPGGNDPGVNAAIYGNATSTFGTGVLGTGFAYGIYGASNNQSGGVGVGGVSNEAAGVLGSNTSSGYGVHGTSTSGVAGRFEASSDHNAIWASNTDTSGSAAAITSIAGSTSGIAYWGTGGIEIQGSVTASTNGGSWSVLSSDARVKKDIRDYVPGLAEILRVRPRVYKYNGLGGTEDDGTDHVGMIAQELEAVMPDMITWHKAKLHPEDKEEIDIRGINPSNFTYMLINAVQEQQKTIEQQSKRLSELENGRRLVVSGVNLNGLGFGVGGLAIAGAIVLASRRKRDETGPSL